MLILLVGLLGRDASHVGGAGWCNLGPCKVAGAGLSPLRAPHTSSSRAHRAGRVAAWSAAAHPHGEQLVRPCGLERLQSQNESHTRDRRGSLERLQSQQTRAARQLGCWCESGDPSRPTCIFTASLASFCSVEGVCPLSLTGGCGEKVSTESRRARIVDWDAGRCLLREDQMVMRLWII